MIAVGVAEGDLANAWRTQLLAVQKAAANEVTTTLAGLRAARRDGGADLIAQWRYRFDSAKAELVQVSDAVLKELRQIRTAELTSHIDRLDQMQRTWAVQRQH
ncbi:hypothetical protein ACQPXH_00510 [Nocardia sp. CA-135953]|uniref:hypothetical protein n=1 Tax=Nocardia sp. CA-135953 TaxID=3239978 RepID=UPI003D980549